MSLILNNINYKISKLFYIVLRQLFIFCSNFLIKRCIIYNIVDLDVKGYFLTCHEPLFIIIVS
jgi:hypothetical protein